jgi:hypothetical protein
VAKVYVNRLELSLAVNLLTSAGGASGASNDWGLQFKHSFLLPAHRRKPRRLPPVA